MKSLAILDTNLLVLFVVGSASIDFIPLHKRLAGFVRADYDELIYAISGFQEIVLVPHILAEASNLLRQIRNPARSVIQQSFRALVLQSGEFAVAREAGLNRDEFQDFGLNDAILLHVCAQSFEGLRPTLLTVDQPLADAASAPGYDVIDFRQEFMTD